MFNERIGLEAFAFLAAGFLGRGDIGQVALYSAASSVIRFEALR